MKYKMVLMTSSVIQKLKFKSVFLEYTSNLFLDISVIKFVKKKPHSIREQLGC